MKTLIAIAALLTAVPLAIARTIHVPHAAVASLGAAETAVLLIERVSL